MTADNFLAYVEGYYGRYPRPAQRKTVAAYLARYTERELGVLSRRLILEYSGQFRFTPDVAVLEDVARKINAETDGWGRPAALPAPAEPDDGGAGARELEALLDGMTKTRLAWRLRQTKRGGRT